MAEDVQFVMDSMVPALRDFVKYGLFKEYEVKSLVNKRREVRRVDREGVKKKIPHTHRTHTPNTHPNPTRHPTPNTSSSTSSVACPSASQTTSST